MPKYTDEDTGKSYDTDSNDTLESARAQKLQYLNKKSLSTSLQNVDKSSVPKSQSTISVDPYKNAAEIISNKPGLAMQEAIRRRKVD